MSRQNEYIQTIPCRPLGPHGWLAGCAALALGLAWCSASAAADVRPAVRKVLPATVSVRAEWMATLKEGRGGDFRPDKVSYSNGTIVSADGLIVAAAERDARDARYEVTLHDGRKLPAKLLVEDLRSRLCLLKVDAKDLPHVALAEGKAELGQPVTAVYSPGGKDRAIAVGIVSAAERVWDGMLVPLVQTDVRVGEASAGAPVADLEGRLVGIVSMRVMPAFQEGSLIVPARYVAALVKARAGEQTVVLRPAYLGVSLQPSPDKRLPLVTQAMPDGPAAKAGLREGDTILALDGQQISTPDELIALVAQQTPGAKVTLQYRRDGEEKSADVVLGQRDQPVPIAQGGETPVLAERVYFGPKGLTVIRKDGKLEVLADSTARYAELQKLLQELAGRKVTLGERTLVLPDTGETSRHPSPPAERPTVRVLRADTDKQIDALRGQLKALQAAMEKLSAQLEKIQKQLPGRPGDKEPARP